MNSPNPNPNPNRNPYRDPYRNAGPNPAPLPHPGNPHDARWLPPHDQDVVLEAHRFLKAIDGRILISMYDATSEFTGDAWIETDAFVPLSHCE